MDLFTILLVSVTVVTVINIRRMDKDASTTSPKAKERCKLHKWVIKGEGEQRYMVCSQCDLLPGSDIQRGKSEGIDD